MTLATRCPACQTAFRISPAQLAAAGGAVRCGRCTFVFNAADYLLPPRVDVHRFLREDGSQRFAIRRAMPIEQPVVDGQLHPPPYALRAESAVRAAPHPSEISPQSHVAAAFERETALSPSVNVPDWSETTTTLPRAHWGWWMAIILCTLLAFLQATWWFRDVWYAASVDSREVLDALSQRFGSTHAAPKIQSALTVENVVLETTEMPHVVGWSFVLRNSKSYPVQLPSVELTLTDAVDYPLVRKVFSPAEYAPPGAVASGVLATQQGLAIRRRLQMKDVSASGYRVYAFY